MSLAARHRRPAQAVANCRLRAGRRHARVDLWLAMSMPQRNATMPGRFGTVTVGFAIKAAISASVLLLAIPFARWWDRGQVAAPEQRAAESLTRIAEQMCSCRHTRCTDSVAQHLQLLHGASLEPVQSDVRSHRELQLHHMHQCRQYVAAGRTFTVATNPDGSIQFVQPAP